MQCRWLLRVLFFCVCFAGAVLGQTTAESKDTPRKQEKSARGGQGETRGQNTVQLVEKRPAWAKTRAGKAAPKTSPEEIPAAVGQSATCYGVQVGAYRSRANAGIRAEKLASRFGPARTLEKVEGNAPLHRVVVGCGDEPKEAEALRTKLAKNGIQGFVVQVDGDSPTPRIVK